MKQFLFVLLFCLSFLSFSQENTHDLKYSISPKILSTEDLITISFTTEGTPLFDLKPLEKDFQIGQPRQSTFSSTYITRDANGNLKKIENKGTKTVILLSPKRAGELTIPTLLIQDDINKSYQLPACTVQVKPLDPSSVSLGEMSLKLSQKSYYVGEAIVGELTILLPAFSDVFQLNYPDSKIVTAAIIKNPNVDPMASRHVPCLFNGSYLPFSFIELSETQFNKKAYINLSLLVSLTPNKTGEIDLPEFSFSFRNIANPRQRDYQYVDPSDPRWKTKNLKSSPVKLLIKNLPVTTAKDFWGLVGKKPSSFTATCNETEVQVGDPILVKLNFENLFPQQIVHAIDWAKQEKLSSLFKFPHTKIIPNQQGNTTTWDLILRPQTDQITEIPSFTLTYFDCQEEIYKQIKTDPIPLKVRPTKIITEPVVGNTPVVTPKDNDKINLEETQTPNAPCFNQKELMRKNTFILDLCKQRIVWFIPVVILFLLLLGSTYLPKIHLPQSASSKKQSHQAEEALKEALKKQNDAQILRTCLLNFIAEQLNISPKAVTYMDAKKIAGLPETQKVFLEFDQIEYTGKSSLSIDELKNAIQTILCHISQHKGK